MKPTRWRRIVLATAATGCVGAGPLARFALAQTTTASTTQPDTQPTTRSTSLAQAIDHLGDADPTLREAASRQLWLAGSAAEPLLRQASTSDDPEVARRARAILAKLALGIYPDTPADIVALVDQYRFGDQQQKIGALEKLATQGPRASRVIMGLGRREKNPQLVAAIHKALGEHGHDAAVLLLAEGDFDGAASFLRDSAPDSESATRDYAALLLLHGGLDAHVAELKAQMAQPDSTLSTARQLTFMARAAGDAQTTRAAAERALEQATAAAGKEGGKSPALLLGTSVYESILSEQQDWAALAKHLRGRLQVPFTAEKLDDLALAAAAARLAGDDAACDKALGEMESFAGRQPPTPINLDEPLRMPWPVAKAMFLNDRVDRGIKLLLDAHDYAFAQEFLTARLQYQQALALPALAAARTDEKPELLLRVRAEAANTLRLVGDRAGAQKMIAGVADDNLSARDFTTWMILVEAARNLGDRASVDTFMRRALQNSSQGDRVQELLAEARIREPELMARWWFELQVENPGDSVETRINAFVPLALGRLLSDDLDGVALRSERWAMSHADARDATLDLLVKTLQTAKADAQAEALLQRWIDAGGGPDVVVRLGEMQAAGGRFTAATQSFAHAWELDRSQAAPLYLQGWAMTKAGDAAGGQQLMKRADFIALAGDEQRYELFDAMKRHRCSDDAEHECELMMRLGGLSSWARCEVMRQVGDRANRRGDYARAAQLWEQAFLPALRKDRGFVIDWANVRIPALLHKTRALASIKKNDVPAALREAKLCLGDSPAFVDDLIEITNALQAAGHTAEADDFFGQTMAGYEKLLAAYPNSAQLNNLVAWGEAMTHRKLDDAVARARRAVELEPMSTSIIDTLAEACFARGDLPGAISAIQKCIDLEPDVARHRAQLARFRTARTRPSTSQPAPSDDDDDSE